MKKNIKEIILIFIGVVLAGTFAFFIFRAKDDIQGYDFSTDESIFFYVDDVYNEFDSTITLDSDNNVTNLLIDGKVWDSLSEPIYYKDIYKVVFPKNMSYIRPLANFKQNRVPYYSIVTYADDVVSVKNSNLNLDVENAFFFDGYDMYFFTSPVTLTYNDKKVTLSSFSYIKCDYKNYLYVFDYKTKSMNKYTDIKTDVIVSNTDYTINVGTDTVYVGDSSAILSKNVDKLSLLK